MVIKGRARGGPVALAKHLERRDTNEKVSVRELRGVTARDVAGALREMDCMAAGALSTRTLYHAAINTAPNERLTDDQKWRAIDRLEAELGFTGQPRIVVEHLKKGREHIHVVFLRIDTDRMVAIPDSHNYRRHEIVARDLEREFGHQRVQGAHIGREDQERPERTPGHDEMQQAERSGLSPQAAKEQITRLWNQADSGMAFAAAVKNAGWVLAKGDRRDFVLVDAAGETHSLARRIEGAKAADIRKRMGDVDPAALPNAIEAKALQREASESRSKIPAPIVLKVPARPGFDPARPLQPVERSVEPAKIKNREGEPPKQTAQRKKPEPNAAQRLYSKAVKISKHAYTKAKEILDKKSPRARKSAPHQSQSRSVQPPEIAPTRIAPTKSLPSQKPAPKRMPVPNPAPKKRMSREELDEMIGRQRQQRNERGGPSR